MYIGQEIQLNFIEMTVPEYAKATGQKESTVRRHCELGILDAYKISDGLKGSHWRIKVPKGDTVSREQYEQVLKENAELRAKLDFARKALA